MKYYLHRAEQLFNEMAHEAGVKVHLNARIASVKRKSSRITEMVTEEGTLFRVKMYIDTSYEGDLMAKAGVGYPSCR